MPAAQTIAARRIRDGLRSLRRANPSATVAASYCHQNTCKTYIVLPPAMDGESKTKMASFAGKLRVCTAPSSWTNLQGFLPTGPQMPLKIFFPTPADLNWSVINPIESVTNQVGLVTNQVGFVVNQVVFVVNQVVFVVNQVVFVVNQVGLVTNQVVFVTNQVGLVTDLIRSVADLGGKTARKA